MVFIKELGFDPDEWEECLQSENFLFFGPLTRIILTITTIGISAIFFFLLELNAKKTNLAFRDSKNLCNKIEKIDLSKVIKETIIQRSQSPQHDQHALNNWKKEVQKVAEQRLQFSNQIFSDIPYFAKSNNKNILQKELVNDNIKLQQNTNKNLLKNDFFYKKILDKTNADKCELSKNVDLINFESKNINFNSTQDFIVCSTSSNKIHNFDAKKNNDCQKSIEIDDTTAEDIEYIKNKENNFEKTKLNPDLTKTNQIKKLLQEYDLTYSTTESNLLKNKASCFDSNDKINNNKIFNINDNKYCLNKESNLFDTSNTSKNLIESKFLSEDSLSNDKTSYDLLESYALSENSNNEQIKKNQYFNTANNNLNIEEGMLESNKKFLQHKEIQTVNLEKSKNFYKISAEPTSLLVKTCEIFEKPENVIFDDADDAITYAPEIQSLEIPPDQLSENENSLNLIENFLEQSEIPVNNKKKNLDVEKFFQSQINNIKKKNENIKNYKIPEQNTIFSKKLLKKSIKNIKFTDNADSTREKKEIKLNYNEEEKIPAAPSIFSLNTNKKIQFNKKLPKFMRRNTNFYDESESLTTSSTTSKSVHKQSSLLSALGVTSTQEMLLKLTNLDELSKAIRKAGLGTTNLIFGIDYTASNKYQGEHSFYGLSLHSIGKIKNPYQQVIEIVGNTLAPFATNKYGIPVFGFGDLKTGDWSVFPLYNENNEYCKDLAEVLRTYNQVTPQIDLSGPTNFAPLIYRAISFCQKIQDYHILVIIADGQVTNDRATRKAIVHACQYPLSIIVVGVGDGPWDMMKIFDESLPKRPWDNFHFVEFHQIMQPNAPKNSNELKFAIQSLLEVPDQYNYIKKMGILPK